MKQVRSRAKVTVTQAVDGTVQHRRKPRAAETRPRARTVREVVVDPRVMEAARQAIRPGQELRIVDETTVRLVNKRED